MKPTWQQMRCENTAESTAMAKIPSTVCTGYGLWSLIPQRLPTASALLDAPLSLCPLSLSLSLPISLARSLALSGFLHCTWPQHAPRDHRSDREEIAIEITTLKERERATERAINRSIDRERCCGQRTCKLTGRQHSLAGSSAPHCSA
eukprot:2587280-Rhodomonas_salina.2